MVPFRTDISACDNCGLCCLTPCLLKDRQDVENLAKHENISVRKMLDKLQFERTPDNNWQVRIKPVNNRCPYHVNMQCEVHRVKPRGGLEFECWSEESYRKTYYWSKDELNNLGVSI